MKPRLLLALLFVLAHTVTAATAQQTIPASGAHVRFANLYQDASGLSVSIDGAEVVVVAEQPSLSDYVDVTAMEHQLMLQPRFDDPGTVVSGVPMTVTFADGHNYLVVLSGSGISTASEVIDLNVISGGWDATALSDLAHVIFFNGAGGAPAIVMSLHNESTRVALPLEGQLSAMRMMSMGMSTDAGTLHSGGFNITPGNYTVSGTLAADPDAVLFSLTDVAFEANTLYLIAVVGNAAEGVQAVVLADDGASAS